MQLQMLGGLRLKNSSFARLNPLLLLAYLNLEGKQSRRDVAEFFWIGYKNPLSNLSMALSHLRKLEPELIQTDKYWVESHVYSDAQAFLEALPNENALTHYQGSFLEGVFLANWNEEVESWVYEKREDFALKTQSLLFNLADKALQEGNIQKASQKAEEAYSLAGAPPLSEDNLFRAYRLLQASQHPFAEKVKREAEDLGLTLKGLPPVTTRVQNTQPALPEATAPLIGREQDIAELLTLLRQKNCRLITLTGLSGVGKSRLALELAHQVQAIHLFPDGVFYVPLFGVLQFDEARQRAAKAINLSKEELERSEDTIRRFFQDKTALLILDSVDYLLELNPYIRNLLKRCVNTKVLLTSEERVRMPEEQLYPLKGLQVNGEAEALQLFAERAKKLDPKFIINKNNHEAVKKICQMVDGSPLAIELAATWIKLLSPQLIAEEIEQNLDFLTTNLREPASDYSSIRAAFEQTWQRLEPQDQLILQALARLQTSFSYEAAIAISQSSSQRLLSLNDKSLLESLPNGRFQLPRLIKRFVTEKVETSTQFQHELEKRYLSYFETSLISTEQRITQAEHMADVLEEMESDFPNINYALELALKHKNTRFLEKTETTFHYYFDLSGHLSQGISLYERTLSYLTAQGKEALEAWSRYVAGYLHLLYRQARPFDALEFANKVIVRLSSLGQEQKLAGIFLNCGQIHTSLGNISEAKEAFQKSLHSYQKFDFHEGQRLVQLALAELALLFEDNPPEQPFEQDDALEHVRDDLQTDLLFYQARYALRQSKFDLARQKLMASIDLHRRLAENKLLPFVFDTLALVLYTLERPHEAEYYAREGYAQGEKQSYSMKAGLAATLGRILTATQQLKEAQEYSLYALETSLKENSKPIMLKSLVSVAEQYLIQNDTKTAKMIFQFALDQPSNMRIEQPFITKRLAELTETLEQDKTLELEPLVRTVITELKKNLKMQVTS